MELYICIYEVTLMQLRKEFPGEDGEEFIKIITAGALLKESRSLYSKFMSLNPKHLTLNPISCCIYSV